MKLLNINASIRGTDSRTLSISDEFLKTLKSRFPEMEVKTIDLFEIGLPEMQLDSVDTKYRILGGGQLENVPESWRQVTTYAKEFLEADVYLISSPMWNFSIPYKLKHYIDIIMQPGLLFKFTETGVQGLANNKKMICITTRGSDYSENSPIHHLDSMEPYLRSIFGLAGITDITFINAQPLDYTPELGAMMLEKAKLEATLTATAFEEATTEAV